jgi:TonB family protein
MLEDRRRHIRQLVTPHLYVALNSSISGGILTDMSEGGMALNLLGPPVSDDVLLDLDLSGTDEHFQTKGRITWTKGSERRVGLKFVDLTESSLLQIKKWLANVPVTGELNQRLQKERNEPGANLRDAEAPESADSRAIALNHEELETTAPVTNAPETQTPEPARSPAIMSDHGGGLLPESQESLAKKSGTGELRNVRFSGWANDGVRIKVKTLEALFTEAPRVHADISKPTLRRERNEPVTQAQETQLSEAPRTASVGTAQGDQLLQKESLAKSSVPVDFAPNMPIQRCANTSSSAQQRERQLEKMPEPSDVGTIGDTKTKSPEADHREPNAVLFAASSPGLRNEKDALTPIEQAVQAPKFPTSLTAASEQSDNLAQTLRTSFARSELRQVNPPLFEQKTEEVAIDRVVLRRWILAAVVVFLLIVSLAAARWIYTSAYGPQTGQAAHNVDSKGTHQQLRQENGKLENDEIRPADASVRRPRVSFDAQKRRKGLSQVNTAVKVPPAIGETNQVPEDQSTGPQAQQQVGKQVGHVSLHAAANLPEQIILPAYPAVAWQKSVQGRVTLNALISKDGTLRNIRLVGPRPSSLLSSSVLEAVKKWRYQPRIENGMPVEVGTQITIDFEK